MKDQWVQRQPDFTVCNISTENVFRDKNFSYSYRKGRTKHGFVYIVSGRMCDTFFESDSDAVYLEPGALIFLPKGCSYIGTYLEDGTQIKIIQFDLADGTLPSYLSKPTKLQIPGIESLIEAFFQRDASVRHPFYYLSCIYELLWRIDEAYVRIPSRYKKLKPALAVLAEQYAQNPPISYYATLCGMSEPNFRRLFREYTGLSPIDYRNDLRLQNARSKLQSDEYNVTEAAEAVGFSNLSFFIRLYKRKYGHTPKKE